MMMGNNGLRLGAVMVSLGFLLLLALTSVFADPHSHEGESVVHDHAHEHEHGHDHAHDHGAHEEEASTTTPVVSEKARALRIVQSIAEWIWIPVSLYAYYLVIVLPVWHWASRTFNDDHSLAGAPSTSSSSSAGGKKAAASSKGAPSWPVMEISFRSLITISLLLVLSTLFYVPLILLADLPGDHVLAKFFVAAVASFMNARSIQIIIFTPISVRRQWSIVRFFVECTSLVESVEAPSQAVSPAAGKKGKQPAEAPKEGEEEEEDSQAKAKKKAKKVSKETLKPLRTWSEVQGFALGLFLKAAFKFLLMLVILQRFHDDDSRYELDVPSPIDVLNAVPTVIFGFPQPFGHPVISHRLFFYFFLYHAGHGFAFFLLMSAFSDFGAAFDALFLGPSETSRVVDMWNSPFFATSPREFWGRRWNLLFRSIFHQLLFVPIALGIDPVLEYLQLQTIAKKKKRIPTHLVKKTALLNPERASPEGRLISATCVFLFSGLLHEWINYVAFGERSMENVAFFLLHAAACAVQTQAIQTYANWKQGEFSSFWQQALCWLGHSVWLILTAPLFFGPYHRAQFFPRLLTAFGLRR